MTKTRFAPSPTGFLHIGGLRTALYNYFFAKHTGGKMVLRIEDTDQKRKVEGAIESLLRVLKTMGIEADEGPCLQPDGSIKDVGANGPYIQSQRLEIYRKFAQQLIYTHQAYYCFCSKERLEAVRKQQEIAKQPSKYDRHCLTIPKEQAQARVEAGEKAVVRLLIPEGVTEFQDLIRGTIRIENREVDDQILLKSDGFPTYHLANVVDDHLMEITHVIRAEEWLSSVPKHLVLYRAFGWDAPHMVHLPLVLNPDRTKLSKRQGDVAVEDYLAKGFLPEALVNFVALIGWNPKADQEIYSLRELTSLFEIGKVNKSGGVFNQEKLDWINGQYIRNLPVQDLHARLKPFLKSKIEATMLEKIISVERSRLVRLTDFEERILMYIHKPVYEPRILVWKKADAADARTQLKGVHDFLVSLPEDTFADCAELEQHLKTYVQEHHLQNGNVFWPLRVALSGSEQSASPFELMWIFGKKESLERLQTAMSALRGV